MPPGRDQQQLVLYLPSSNRAICAHRQNAWLVHVNRTCKADADGAARTRSAGPSPVFLPACRDAAAPPPPSAASRRGSSESRGSAVPCNLCLSSYSYRAATYASSFCQRFGRSSTSTAFSRPSATSGIHSASASSMLARSVAWEPSCASWAR